MDVMNCIDTVGDRTTMLENSNGLCGIYKCKRFAWRLVGGTDLNQWKLLLATFI